MSYQEDTIDWQSIQAIDTWLDLGISEHYKQQPLATDWSRVCKIGEELGETIQALIGATGQNPRKGFHGGYDEVLDELADVVITAIMAMQHFTKDPYRTKRLIITKLAKIEDRIIAAKEDW